MHARIWRENWEHSPETKLKDPENALALVAQLPGEDCGVVCVDAAVDGVGALRDGPHLNHKGQQAPSERLLLCRTSCDVQCH